MSDVDKITRRQFLRYVGVSAEAVVLGFHVPQTQLLSAVQERGQPLSAVLERGIPIFSFVFLNPLNGTITLVSFRSEMGQGIRSSLAAVLADELEADWNRVTVHQADADSLAFAVRFPFDVPGAPDLVAGNVAQRTNGSRSMALFFQPMRLLGAGIRLSIIRAAAWHWGVDSDEVEARQHKVLHRTTGRSLDYGDTRLLFQLSRIPLPTYEEAEAALKPPSAWRFLSRQMPFVDIRDFVTGKAIYAADCTVPDRHMLTASIERCPVANGRLLEFDPAPALAVTGVRKVQRVLPPSIRPGGVGRASTPHAGLAVLATNTWAAMQGRKALKPTIKWDVGSNSVYDSKKYYQYLKASVSAPGKVFRQKGDVEAAFEQSAKLIEATYYIPHLAQAPMEPPVAIAVTDGPNVDVWAPTQDPVGTQEAVARAVFNVSDSEWASEKSRTTLLRKVRVHVPLLGGSFGRKLQPDFVVEAAYLANQNPGVAIRVQWSREDDIRFSYYNGVSMQFLKAGLNADGRMTALLQRSAFTSSAGTFFDLENLHGTSSERAEGLEDMPFDVANLRIENCPARNYIRVGCMRSGANIYHAFAIGSFADELANLAGCDSKDYLLDLIGKGHILRLAAEGVENFENNQFPVLPIEAQSPVGGQRVQVSPAYPPDTRRLRAVIERVAKAAGWDDKKRSLPKGRGFGIAAHRSRLSYVALVVDVSLSDAGELTVNEIHGAIDCGLAVNPDRIIAQMEGGIIYGLSLALFGEITVERGAVVQSDFDDYPVLRMKETPKISVHIVASAEPPTGAGEPPTPVVAPALANAIFAAGGPRIRELPFYKAITVKNHGLTRP